jgi:hypothetical protein
MVLLSSEVLIKEASWLSIEVCLQTLNAIPPVRPCKKSRQYKSAPHLSQLI